MTETTVTSYADAPMTPLGPGGASAPRAVDAPAGEIISGNALTTGAVVLQRVATTTDTAPLTCGGVDVDVTASGLAEAGAPDDESEDSEFAPFIKLAKEPWRLLQKYRKTRTAVHAHEPLYSLSVRELKARDMLGPWAFNLAKVTIAATPTLIAIKICSFLWPIGPVVPVGTPVMAIRMGKNLAAILEAIQPLLIPLILLCTAPMLAAASLNGRDDTRDRRRLATAAYLYFDGAFSVIPQFWCGFTSAMAFWLYQRVPALTILCVVLFAYACCHMFYTIGGIIPRCLFELHGYSTKTYHVWTRRDDRPTNPAPWSRYKLAIFVGAPIISWGVVIGALLISYALAAALTALQVK